MALTITNTNTLTLLTILNRNVALQSDLVRQLATGSRINSAKDDPAGLIALENFNAELSAVNAALSNNQRTDAMLTVADGAIGEISSLLRDIETLVLASSSPGGLTDAEIALNQAQIDDALAAIDRIARTTNFNGKRLLDGSLAFGLGGFTPNAYLTDLRVFSHGNTPTETSLTVTRVAPAEGASALFAMAGRPSRTVETSVVAITGGAGAATLTIADGSKQSDIVDAINSVTDQTGVSAVGDAFQITLHTTETGSDAFISVEVLSGGLINSNNGSGPDDGDPSNDMRNVSRVSGSDAVVTINGQPAGTDGLDVYYSANGLSLALTMSRDFANGNTPSSSTSFTLSVGGGATFQLGTTAATLATLGLDSLTIAHLGGSNGTARLIELRSGGSVDLLNDPAGALRTVRAAIEEVAQVRGRVAGFQKYQVGSAIRSLEAAREGLTNVIGAIADTDVAATTAALNRQQVLIQAGIFLLGIVNEQAAQVLSLLK